MRERWTRYSTTVSDAESSQNRSIRLSPSAVGLQDAAAAPSSQPQLSKRNEAICVRQSSVAGVSIPVNQKVQSSAGSRLIAA